MSDKASCPTCGASVTVSGGGWYDDPVSYHFDSGVIDDLRERNARLQASVKKLRSRLSKARARSQSLYQAKSSDEL